MRSQLKKVTSVILCVCMLMSILAITSFADETTATISFADKANRTAYSADQQIWVQNGITVTNDKGESTSNVGDYANPGRFYKSSTFKIEYPGMTKIEIDCTGLDAKHVKAWTDSFEGATENGGIVTVEFAQAVDSASVKMAAQGRANSITVYTAAGSEEGGEVEGVELLVSHHNLYNWGTFESMIITGAGKTVKDVINQTPYWWIMYVVENVDGEYVATKYYKDCDEINTTVVPEGGFLYYVYSENSAWAKVVEGALLGYTFELADFTLDEAFAIDTNKNPDAAKHLLAFAPVVEDDESYKDTYTYVDGVNNGTSQSRADGWESIPVLDFWYLVEDGETTVTIKYAVDNKVITVDDTMFRIWVETFGETEKPWTTLYDFKVNADGNAYEIPHATSIADGYVSFEYSVVGNDYFFTLVLDKAVVGIDGEYALNLQLGQTGYNTLHSTNWDSFDTANVPWVTTEFYEVFGKEVKTTLTIEEAIALGESKEHNTYTDEKYYVTGVITSVYSEQYGNMYIEDENGNRLTIYGTYSADGELRYDAMEVKPVKGDTVTIYGRVGQYNGTAQIKNGWIVDHVPGEGDDEEEVPDPEADSTLTIEQAIALGASKDHNNYTSNKYYVTGVITEVYNEQYGNMKITDDNGNILTIYGTYSADGELRYDALEVKPVAGDTVTIYGIVGQYNDVAQVKNGWITAHTAASGNESSDDVSDESTEDDTPILGDSGFAIEMVIVMVIALAAVAVVYRTKRRA